MDLLINIISIAGPLIFAACVFALKNIPQKKGFFEILSNIKYNNENSP